VFSFETKTLLVLWVAEADLLAFVLASSSIVDSVYGEANFLSIS